MYQNSDALIATLLDRIDAVYTVQRKEKIKKMTEAFWDHTEMCDHLPYAAFKPECDIPDSELEAYSTYDRELIWQLSAIAKHGETWDDAYYPALSPGCRQLTLPSYFGCVEEHAENSVQVKPIIMQPEDVYSLPELGFTPENAGGEMLEKMKYWRQKTSGRISFYIADMQGPFSIASQIWGIEKFLLACYDFPDEVHTLISKCCDIYIEYFKKMREITENDLIGIHCQPCLWLPLEKGVALSEDLVAVVSGQMVEEFMNPYLERIAHEFGGVLVHTCGSMNHVLKALCKVEGLFGVNFSSCETNLPLAATQIREDMCIVCHNSPVKTEKLQVLDSYEHARLVGQVYRETKVPIFPICINVNDNLQSSREDEIKMALKV